MSNNQKLSPLAYKEIDGDQYTSVVPASESPAEFTIKAIIIGIVIGIIFGAANAYLGLKVGLTVSASIPAAVMAVAIFKIFFKSGTILETNLVQTIGSAGESVAAGVIFTIPAFFVWGEQITRTEIALMAIIGGLIGVIFMIPLRRSFISKEHGKLPYPEGTACAEVLVSGQGDVSKAKTLFWGMGIGALYTALMHGNLFGLWNKEIGTKIPGYKAAEISGEITPELLGVGYIIGPQIAAIMLGGGLFGWLVLIPLIALMGECSGVPIYPATDMLIKDMTPGDIWSNYIKYIGAGGVAFAGIFSLLKSIPMMWTTFKSSIKMLGKNDESATSKRTDTDLSFKTVLIAAAILVLAATAYVKVYVFTTNLLLSLLAGFLIVLFGFFFVTVSSRIVGLLGSSSNPISGMTIATLLLTSIIFVVTGLSAMPNAKIAVLTVGAFVCIAAAIAGDTSQDLKTGFLVGSTPKYQQIGEVIGVVTAGLTMGFVMYLLKDAIVAGQLTAPQANLMRTVIDGVLGGNLPWALVICGGFISLVVEMLGISSLGFAVGMYLPVSVSTPIIIGGLIRWWIDRKKDDSQIDEKRESGVLYSSGLIAGAALLGVLMMVVMGFANNLSAVLEPISRPGIHIEAQLNNVTINNQPFTGKYYKVGASDISSEEGNKYVIKGSYNGVALEKEITLGKYEKAYLSISDGKLTSSADHPDGNLRGLIAFVILSISLCYFTLRKPTSQKEE